VARTLECPPETIRILIHELAPDGFYVAGQTMAERKAAKAKEKENAL
jgi:phenylpyruvate tautomerase PptA (4-oxalocrotonate tautomerase family)